MTPVSGRPAGDLRYERSLIAKSMPSVHSGKKPNPLYQPCSDTGNPKISSEEDPAVQCGVRYEDVWVRVAIQIRDRGGVHEKAGPW